MEQKKSTTSRKKFFLWSVGVLASVSAFKYFMGNKKSSNKKDTVKMLTQNGTLVEIDKELLKSSTERVTNKELQTWIKK
jgi:hypothetical protein